MKNNNLIIILVLVIFIFVGTIGGFFYGRYTKSNELTVEEAQVNSQTILSAIEDQYFVVTKVVYSNEDIEIVVVENSDWSDLLWKKVIYTEANVRTDIGVDMQGITDKDIKIDHENKTVTINLPDAEIFNSSIDGDLKYESKSGVITKIDDIFKKDSKDYNLAKNSLIESAENAVSQKNEIFDEAEESSTELLSVIIENLGYELVVE